MAFLVTMQR